jgi:hypothetical protein
VDPHRTLMRVPSGSACRAPPPPPAPPTVAAPRGTRRRRRSPPPPAGRGRTGRDGGETPGNDPPRPRGAARSPRPRPRASDRLLQRGLHPRLSSSASFRPSGPKNLMPLSSTGLWDAETTTPAEHPSSRTRCATAGVGRIPAWSTRAPPEQSPATKAASNMGPETRVSRASRYVPRPRTAAAARPTDRANSGRRVRLATPRIPSVPNRLPNCSSASRPPGPARPPKASSFYSPTLKLPGPRVPPTLARTLSPKEPFGRPGSSQTAQCLLALQRRETRTSTSAGSTQATTTPSGTLTRTGTRQLPAP